MFSRVLRDIKFKEGLKNHDVRCFCNKTKVGEPDKFHLSMVFRHISKDLKECALWLILHGYAPEDVCELFDISSSSVGRWKHNNRVYGSIIPPPNPIQCRSPILSGNMMDDLYRLT